MTTVTPRPASSFVEQSGVVVQSNRPQYANNKWQQPLIAAGFRHIRGKLGSNKADVQWMKPIIDKGIKICTTIVATSGGTLDKAKAKANIAAIDTLWGGTKNVIAAEGPNEFNNTGSRPANWAAIERDFIEWMWKEIRSRPSLAQLLVAGPSIWKRILADYKALGNIDPFVNRNTLHWYTDTKRPTNGNTTLDQGIVNVGILSSKQILVTECGVPNKNPPRIQSKYAARVLFELLRRPKIERAYLFEMSDVDPSPKWGLLDGNFQPRMHYYTIKNLLALYADSGAPNVAPFELDITAPSTALLGHMIHRRSDGRALISLGRDVDAKDADIAPASVNLDFGKQVSARLHLPTFSTAPKDLGSASGFTVPVTDQLAVVEVQL